MFGILSKIRNLISNSSPRKIAVIAFSLILLAAIPLTVYVSQQQQQTKQHASFINPSATFSSFTKDYQQLITEKLIDPATQILEIGLAYDESKNPQVSFLDTRILNGYVPYQFANLNPNTYTLQELDRQKNVLYSLKFEIPNTPYMESFDFSEKIESQSPTIKQVEFGQALPWSSSSSEVIIIDPQGRIVATRSLLNIPKMKNIPDFHSIRGDEFLKKIQNVNLINLDFKKIFFPKAFAGSSAKGDGFVDIVFIGDKYNNDFDHFHKDMEKLILGFLKIEPFKSRASQIRFNYVDNKIDLECGNNIIGIPGCNNSRIINVISNNGVPYDYIVVLNNKNNIRGSISLGIQAIIASEHTRDLSSEILAHELGGHLIGKLFDEYLGLHSAVKFFQKTLGKFKGNCHSGSMPNPEWKNLVGEGDYSQGCLEKDWFGASKDDLMKGKDADKENPYLNAVSQKIINERMDRIVGPFTEDKTSPQVQFISPGNNLPLPKREITIRTQATDDRGVAYVQFWVDNVFLKTAYIAPYEFVWDASSEKEGSHALLLKAYDVSGNVGQTEKNYTLTSNDELLHKIKITLGGDLKDGMTIDKPTRVDTKVSEEDKSIIREIGSFIDGNLEDKVSHDRLKEIYGHTVNSQYGFWIDPKKYSPGSHKFYAQVNDDRGVISLSDTITFNVINNNSISPILTFILKPSIDVSAPTSNLYSQCLTICDQGTLIAPESFDKPACIQQCDSKYKSIPTVTPTSTFVAKVTPTLIPSVLPSPVLTPISTSSSIPTPTISVDFHSLGDANGDGKIDYAGDFNIWLNEMIIYTTKKSDFNEDGIVNTNDYNIWRDSMNNPNLPH